MNIESTLQTYGGADADKVEEIGGSEKAILFVLVLLAAAAVFVPRAYLDIRATTLPGFLLYAFLAGAYLTTALVFRTNTRLEMYSPVAYALFTFAVAWPLANELGRWLGGLLVPSGSVMAVVSATIRHAGATIAPAAAIIVLTLLSGEKLSVLYLQRGNLRRGLAIGLGSFLAFSVLAFSPIGIDALTRGLGLTFQDMLPLIPWILVSVLLNGFREEILFRGIFLRRLTSPLGFGMANVLLAAIFALPHFGVAYSSQYFAIIALTFCVGLVFAYLARKTDSLIAPSLSHAALDLLVWTGIYASL